MKINHRDIETQLNPKSCVSVSLWFKLCCVGLLLLLACANPAAAQEPVWVRDTYRAGDFELVREGRAADVLVSSEDFKVVRTAANDLAADVERVTGVSPSVRTEPTGLSGYLGPPEMRVWRKPDREGGRLN